MTEVLLAIGGVVLACVLSYITARGAGKASKDANQVTVDALAYTRAREMYESALATGAGEISSLKQDVTDLKAKVEAQSAEIQNLRHQVVRYEGRVDQLEGTLRRHQIAVPPWSTRGPGAPEPADDPNKPARTTET